MDANNEQAFDNLVLKVIEDAEAITSHPAELQAGLNLMIGRLEGRRDADQCISENGTSS
jgi:hypothetical protein